MEKKQRTERRADALSKPRIIDAAIDILDTEGEAALTFRALAARLETGSGALYWHVADKDDLLLTATDTVLGRALAGLLSDAPPKQAIRAIALAVFDTIDAHPWIGYTLVRAPCQKAVLQIFEGIGGCLQALGVPAHAQFDGWSALINYILGVAGQNAANARLSRVPDRTQALGDIAARWAQLDADTYPFLRQMAGPLRDHDDRDQFLAGIDLILAGLEHGATGSKC